MSAREWKPGDVATWPGMGVVICVAGRDASVNGTKWAHRWGGFSYYDGEGIRPMVVIDPETAVPGFSGSLVGTLLAASAEIVEEQNRPRVVKETALLYTLADLFDAATGPVKPAEPRGLGAVVEDNRGKTWVRVRLSRTGWCGSNGVGHWYDFASIDAVKVLTEGSSE